MPRRYTKKSTNLVNNKADMNAISARVGITVILKSGGPLMTISKFVDIEHVECTWFVNHTYCGKEIFPIKALVSMD